MADPLAMARLLMGGQAQTAGTAFEPVTWQQQLQNYKGLEGQENAWRTAEGSPWKPAEPGPVAKAIGNALTSQTGQRLMDLANFLGPGPKMMPRPTMAPEGPKGIRAYHGSPHDFDRFDLSRIGTGEGAQAYGRGLYFAEAEGVAKQYRDTLGDVKINGKPADYDNPTHWVALAFDEAKGNPAAAVAELRGWWKTSSLADREAINKAIAAVESGSVPALPKVEQSGRMYEVNIKADPDQFLDWDVPLSKQSEKVRAAVESAIGERAQNPLFRRMFLDQGKAQDAYGAAVNVLGGPDKASETLRQAGIPGIRYKDAGSRDGPGGTSNYVVFDDKLIDIVKKYGLAALLMGGATGGGSNSGNAAP